MRGICVLLALVEAAFVPAIISWSNFPARAPAIPIHAQMLKWATISGVALFVLHRIYLLCFPSRFGRSVFLMIIDGIFCLLQAVLVTLLLHPWYDAFRLDLENSPAVALTVGQQVILVFFGAYRIARLLQSTTGGVSGGSAQIDDSESTQLLGNERFTLIWVTRSADLLIGYLPEMDNMLQVLRRSLYVGREDAQIGNLDAQIGNLLKLRIYCTDPDPEKRKELLGLLGQHPCVKDAVQFRRPNLEENLIDVMKEQIVASQDSSAPHKTLLTFCGSPTVADACLHGCAQANELAASLGHTARMEFREEFYGHTSGMRRLRSKKKSGVVSNSPEFAVRV